MSVKKGSAELGGDSHQVDSSKSDDLPVRVARWLSDHYLKLLGILLTFLLATFGILQRLTTGGWQTFSLVLLILTLVAQVVLSILNLCKEPRLSQLKEAKQAAEDQAALLVVNARALCSGFSMI